MNKKDIHLLYQYNRWANARILDAATKISEAQFLAPTTFSHRSLRGTLVHTLFAEWIWRLRWQGSAPNVRWQKENRMKAIEIRDTFGVNSLKLVERPDPVPGPGQVVLKMKAFSINYRDLLVVNGVGRWKPSLPRIPLSDGVGIVAAMGNGVSRVKVGDRVAPIFYPKWIESNGYRNTKTALCDSKLR